jgi:spore germination protein YaaH
VDELIAGEYLVEVSADSLQGLVVRQSILPEDTVVNLGSRRLQYTGELRGNIQTAGIDSVQNLRIHLVGMNRYVAPKADGSFSFGRVPAGVYAFAITMLTNATPVRQGDEVAVNSNQTTNMKDLSLTDSSWQMESVRLRFPEITCWFDTGAARQGFDRYQTDPQLFHELNPQWYALTNQSGTSPVDGSLYECAAIDPAQVTAIHANGQIILPTITSGGADRIAALISSEGSRQNFIQNCIEIAEASGYDGWLVHFPEGTAASRELFSGFIRTLVDSLHRHELFLSLSLPLIASQEQELQTHIDLAKLSVMPVNSYKIFPLLDVSSTPAPIAAYTSICQSLDYLIQSRMEARKIQVTLHTFVRRYQKTGSGGYLLREGELPYQVYAAANSHPVDWDEAARESMASFVAGDTTWTDYLGDARTVTSRLDLFDKYDLLGFSLWAVGREDSTVLSETHSFFR